MPNQQFDERGLLLLGATFDSTYAGGTDVLLKAAYTGPQRFDALMVWSTDTVAHKLTLKLDFGQPTLQRTDITIPAADPSNLPVVLELISKLFPVAGVPYVSTSYQGNINIALDAAPSSGTYVSVLLMGGTF